MPEAACWVVSHEPEPEAVPGRSCKLRSSACPRALHQIFWGASQRTQIWPWRRHLGCRTNAVVCGTEPLWVGCLLICAPGASFVNVP